MRSSIQLHPMGHVAMAARTWRRRGRALLTVIVKGTFGLRHEASMSLASPLPIVVDDQRVSNDPIASLTRQSDLALVVPRPEITVVGAVFAGRGLRVAQTTVRLAVQREGRPLLDKRLEVLGDRRAALGAPPPAPTPFERMPITYERALGGITSRENPVGRGLVPDADGLVSLPNIVAPQGGGVAPAGLGPIPSGWPLRTAFRGSLSAAAFASEGQIEVPDDFDETYFQAAPVDQRVGDLRGGDVITLVRLHPDLETLRTALPALRGVALLQTGRGDRIPIALRIDTVHLDPAAMRAEIVHRGALTVTEEQLAQLRIAGALESPDHPFAFPDLSMLPRAPSVPPPPRPTSLHASTVVLEPVAPVAARPTFSGTMLLEPDAPASERRSAPPAPPAPPPPAAATLPLPPSLTARAASPQAGTMLLEADETASESQRRSATMFLQQEEAPPPSLPFARGKRKRSGQVPAVITSKAATPWAVEPEAAPAQSADGITSTILVDEPAPPAPAPSPTAAAKTDPEPLVAPTEPRGASKSPWRVDAGALPVVGPAAPPKQVLPPRTDVKGTLYKKPKR